MFIFYYYTNSLLFYYISYFIKFPSIFSTKETVPEGVSFSNFFLKVFRRKNTFRRNKLGITFIQRTVKWLLLWGNFAPHCIIVYNCVYSTEAAVKLTRTLQVTKVLFHSKVDEWRSPLCNGKVIYIFSILQISFWYTYYSNLKINNFCILPTRKQIIHYFSLLIPNNNVSFRDFKNR